MVSVFVSKFDPNLDAITLSDYLKDKLDREVKCRKIETTLSRFSSFCVTAECDNVAEMYDPHLWPAGKIAGGGAVRLETNPRYQLPAPQPVVCNGESLSAVSQLTSEC